MKLYINVTDKFGNPVAASSITSAAVKKSSDDTVVTSVFAIQKSIVMFDLADTLKDLIDIYINNVKIITNLSVIGTTHTHAELATAQHTHAATDITQSATHRFVTDTEKSGWDSKQAGSAKLTGLAGLTDGQRSIVVKTGDNTFATRGLSTTYLLDNGTDITINTLTIPTLTNGKLSDDVIPAIAITDTFEVATQNAMLALTAQVGDVAIRTDENKCYILSATPATEVTNWKLLRTPTDAVLSVNSLTGAVTLTTANIAEGTNRYFTDARARGAVISQTIGNGVTTKSPSEDAVYDALATKSATNHNHTGTYEPANAGLSTLADIYTLMVANGFIKYSEIAGDFYVDNSVYAIESSVVLKSLFDANTILYATTDNTPVALTVAENTVVGRKTGGGISAISQDDLRTMVGANITDLGVNGNIDNLTESKTYFVGTGGTTLPTVAAYYIEHVNYDTNNALQTASLFAPSSVSFMYRRAKVAGVWKTWYRWRSDAETGYIGNPDLVDMAENTIKGRAAAGTGDPEDLSVSQVLTMLGAITASSTDTLTNKTLSYPKISGGLNTTDGELALGIDGSQVSAVNRPYIKPSATGVDVAIYLDGSDTNISMEFYAKGSGQLKMKAPVISYLCTSNPTGVEGMEIYRTDLHKKYVYNGTAWVEM